MVNIVLGILFFLFAVVQYNDPDPWVWMVVYFFISAISFFAFRGKYNKILLLVSMVISLVWMGFLLPGFVNWLQGGMPSIADEMKTTKPHIEVVREFLGLFLVFCALGFHYFQARKAGV